MENKSTKKNISELIEKTKAEIIGAIDENGNGKIDLYDIIIKGIKTPGIAISRETFLKKELIKFYPERVVNNAIATNPMTAGVKSEDVDKIANSVINYERNCVSAISAALGAPGGLAVAATVPADIMQYYGYMLRCAQKLLYLYGYPDLNLDEKGTELDDETLNILTLAFGVMAGVTGANKVIVLACNGLAKGISKKIAGATLTKSAAYVTCKKISKWFGVKLTREVLKKAVTSTLPFVGAAINGTFTFVAFKPCCIRLKKSLEDTALSNPNYSGNEDLTEDNVIDVEVSDADIEFTEEELNSDVVNLKEFSEE